jgi:hypothetical protein
MGVELQPAAGLHGKTTLLLSESFSH